MYGRLSELFYLLGYKWGTTYWALPYRWCGKEEALYTSPGKLRLTLWHFHIIFDLLVVLWAFTRFIHISINAKHAPAAETKFYIFSAASAVVTMFPALLQLNTYWQREQLPQSHFQFLYFVRGVKETYLTQEKLNELMRKDKVGLVAIYLLTASIAFGAETILIMLMYPHRPLLPSSLLNLPQPRRSVFIVAQAMVLSYYMLRASILMMLYAFPALEILASGVFFISEARYGKESKQIYRIIRTEMEFMKLRRTIQLLFFNLTSVYSPLVIPGIKIILLLLIVFGIFGALRLPGLFGMVAAVGGSILSSFLVFVARYAAEIPEIAEETSRSWRRSKQSPELQRFVKSLRPLKIPVGTFYFCDRFMILSMIKFIVETTVDIFLLF